MKSQRISLCGFDDDQNNNNLKQELLSHDDGKEKDNDDNITSKYKSTVTFQRWAAKIIPIIITLNENKSCSIVNGFGNNHINHQNGYANVDRIVDLNTMLKSKYSK